MQFYHVTPGSVRWLWRHSVEAAAAHLRGPPFWCPFWCAFGASDAFGASGVPRNLCSHVIMVRTLPRDTGDRGNFHCPIVTPTLHRQQLIFEYRDEKNHDWIY